MKVNLAFHRLSQGLTSLVTCDGQEQCWTEGRSSTAVAEDFRPTATVAKV